MKCLMSVVVLMAAVWGMQSAKGAKFIPLGDLPGGTFYSEPTGVSANGSIVVGLGHSASGTEAFRWTSYDGMIGLGDLSGGFFQSGAHDVSADGSVVVGNGYSTSENEAFRWTDSSGMVGLGDLPGGGFNSIAYGVSADGSVVVGVSSSTSGGEAFRWTSSGGMVGLGILPGGYFQSAARGVSADGSVVIGNGYSISGQEAFRWNSGNGMVGLGDLAGGSFFSDAYGVSADGSVVVGVSSSTSGGEAFRWTSGNGMIGLGNLPGGIGSFAYDVSADGSVIVGYGASASGYEAFVWDAANQMRSIVDVLAPSVGAALNGWNLTVATDVSADGRTVVGRGTDPSGNTQAWLAYLADDIAWFPQTSGAWDSPVNWSGPFMPGPADDVVIDPTAAVTVTGPNGNRTINTLTIGGSGVGRVTLRFTGASSGDLNVTTYTYLEPNAELVLADDRTFSTGATLFNSGIIRGAGSVDANLTNYASGQVRVGASESLVISGNTHVNNGKLEAIGGSLEFIGSLLNTVGTGLITGRSATLRFQNGLTNNGSVMVSFGTSDVNGDINNSTTGKIIVAGGAAVTFYDDVTQNGTLQVIKVGSTNSVAVFAGAFTGSGGSSGGGDIFFLGDLRPGNSPATVTFNNNVAFGGGASINIELAGTTAGTQHDRINVTGALSLDGTLSVSLFNDFNPTAGQSFDILNWGTLSGTFSNLDLPTLVGHAWDTSQLYTNGTLSIVSAALTGDYNNDGTVNAADYVVWRDHLGSAMSLPNDETPGVNAGDYGVWKQNFGAELGGGSATNAQVPEPTTLVLLLVGILAFAVRRSAES